MSLEYLLTDSPILRQSLQPLVSEGWGIQNVSRSWTNVALLVT